MTNGRCVINISGECVLHGPIPQKVLSAIQRDNSFPNPQWTKTMQMGFSVWNIPKVLCLATGNTEQVSFPRTYLGTAIGILRANSINYEIRRQTFPMPGEMLAPVVPHANADTLLNETLFGYQKQAVVKLLRSHNGLLMSPTGSGKSSMIAAVIAEKNVPAVVLLHTKGLLEQTQKELERFLGIEVGLLGGGKWNPMPVSVGMYQTLVKRDRSDPVFNMFGLMFADECQTVAANTFRKVASWFNALFRYGCSATPSRKDGLTRIIHDVIGPIESKVSVDDVIKAGRIMWPEVETVRTDFWYNMPDSSQWGAMMTALSEDVKRNMLIAAKTRSAMEANPDAKIVILCERINQADMLADLLMDMSPVVLHGSKSAAVQRAGWESIRAGAKLTIATYSICGVGINVPGWEILMMASPIMGGGKYLQALGRITRVAPGKDRALLCDFVDVKIPPLVHGYKQRKKLYELREASS